MTREEKLKLNRERQKAVREAWQRERNLVEQGKGTVDWSVSQQKEIMKAGRVKGYEGQHMKSCSKYPEYAGTVDNIQLLSHEDHLAAHKNGNHKGYISPTNGYYDSKSGQMTSFGSKAPQAPKVIELSRKTHKSSEEVKTNNMAEGSMDRKELKLKAGGRYQ
ncbi:MAG: hypothetical protein JXR41_16385 [Bacteroidales bacterium]|nr:hypothetical protein [Bacteroidales bacterium]